MRVDRLDDEARAGIERSAEFARGDRLARPDDPPLRPDVARTSTARGRPASTSAAVEAFLRFYADACLARGVTPLIENVPPVLRMRTGGVFLSPVGGHWRDLLAWRERDPGAPLHVRHLARGALPQLRRRLPVAVRARRPTTSSSSSATSRSSAPASEVAHVSDAHGLLGEGLPYGSGELDLDPVVAPPRRARAVHRRRDQRARSGALAGHEGRLPRDRARARLQPDGPAAPPRRLPARRLRLAARAAAARPGAGACSSCRSASAAGAC